ncbi:MAG TPA: 50S ribosomal protein L10 [Solirubrobacterales bacterium]|nr:50S ribosomal protein L10 [Solirubrobacterales bacterium]
MDREQKTQLVKELAEELKDAEAIFAVDYRGISVPQAAELRSGLRDADARFRVVKNRLTLRAADEAGTASLKEYLEGPTALTFVKGDAALAAKTLFRLGSEWELLDYKGGLMDGEALDPDSFQAIARLPGRDQLNAQFAGVVASPLTGLVRGLGSMIQGLALQLGQIAEQGLVSGEAPAEAPAEKEEAPKEEEGPPKEDESPAAEADSESSDAELAEAEDDSSGGEAESPSAEESEPDPEPAESPEETSEEEAPEGEDAGQGEASETAEGDQDLGEESPEETPENSDDQKEEGS